MRIGSLRLGPFARRDRAREAGTFFVEQGEPPFHTEGGVRKSRNYKVLWRELHTNCAVGDRLRNGPTMPFRGNGSLGASVLALLLLRV